MARYTIIKNDSMMGMGDQVRQIVSIHSQKIMAYINENAQILFVKPMNCNVAKEIIDFVIETEESK